MSIAPNQDSTLAKEKKDECCYYAASNADTCYWVESGLGAMRQVLARQRSGRRRVSRRKSAVAWSIEQILHGDLGKGHRQLALRTVWFRDDVANAHAVGLTGDVGLLTVRRWLHGRKSGRKVLV